MPGLSCNMWTFGCNMWNLVPWPGIEPRSPLLWEFGILTTGPPGKSLGSLLEEWWSLSCSNYFPNTPLLNIISLGIRFQSRNTKVGMLDTSIQSMMQTHLIGLSWEKLGLLAPNNCPIKFISFSSLKNFFFGHSLWDLSSPARDRTCVPCIGMHNLSYWTPMGVPFLLLSLKSKNLSKTPWTCCTAESPMLCPTIPPALLTLAVSLLFHQEYKSNGISLVVQWLGNIHWKDQCWSWSSSTLATWCEELTRWKRPWCWETLRAGGGVGDWMASPTQWTWVWANSGR